MSKCFVQCASVVFSLTLVFATSGCGGGTANIRVLHAAPDEPPLNVLVDGTIVDSNLPYSSSTAYISVNSGSRQFVVEPVSSDTELVDTTISFAARTNSTVIVTGTSTLEAMVLTDGTQTPAAGSALIRLVNAAPDMRSADIYVVPDGTSITGTPPLVAGLGFQLASAYENLSVPAGSTANYDVYFNEPGTALTLLATGPISLTSGEALTVVSLNGVQGQGFTFQSLMDLK